MKENIKAPRHWPLCGEVTGTGEFPAQRASYAENASIWWRHHETGKYYSMVREFFGFRVEHAVSIFDTESSRKILKDPNYTI